VRAVLIGARNLLRGGDEGPAAVGPWDSFGVAGMLPR
jgi:hypothetical protein